MQSTIQGMPEVWPNPCLSPPTPLQWGGEHTAEGGGSMPVTPCGWPGPTGGGLGDTDHVS